VRDLLGHIHFVDSNRRAPGMGHTDFGPIVRVLREIGYEGYVSAECFPLPDADAAAKQTIETYRKLFRD
jgi:sugar phosphate isomerase/epimerase